MQMFQNTETALIVETLLIELLCQRTPLPALQVTAPWRPSVSCEIEQLALPCEVSAGLFVWNDDLEKAHTLVQPLDSDEAKYWHAIVHRRQGELENALYWINQLGAHPIHDELRSRFEKWTPQQFIEALSTTPNQPELIELQALEMELLLAHCLKTQDSPLLPLLPKRSSRIATQP